MKGAVDVMQKFILGRWPRSSQGIAVEEFSKRSTAGETTGRFLLHNSGCLSRVCPLAWTIPQLVTPSSHRCETRIQLTLCI